MSSKPCAYVCVKEGGSFSVSVSVCVCVWEIERGGVSVCVRERLKLLLERKVTWNSDVQKQMHDERMIGSSEITG
jgi:hypothetical protein